MFRNFETATGPSDRKIVALPYPQQSPLGGVGTRVRSVPLLLYVLWISARSVMYVAEGSHHSTILCVGETASGIEGDMLTIFNIHIVETLCRKQRCVYA